MRHLIIVFLTLIFTTSCAQNYDGVEFKKIFIGTWYSADQLDIENNMSIDVFMEYKIDKGGAVKGYSDITVMDYKGQEISSFSLIMDAHVSIVNKQLLWELDSFEIENFSSTYPEITTDVVKAAFEREENILSRDDIISYDENVIELKSTEDGTIELLTRTVKKQKPR